MCRSGSAHGSAVLDIVGNWDRWVVPWFNTSAESVFPHAFNPSHVLGKGRWVDTDFCGCIWTPFYEIKITTGKNNDRLGEEI